MTASQGVTIYRRINQVVIQPGQATIVQKKTNRVVVSSIRPSAYIAINPFSFVATEGQTVFTLPKPYKAGGIFILAINGILQNLAGSDFTAVDLTLTLSSTVNAGDLVYGFYETI